MFDMFATSPVLLVTGLVAGLLSGAVGFGGGMILLPVISSFYGIEVAVPVSTIAQLPYQNSKASASAEALPIYGRYLIPHVLVFQVVHYICHHTHLLDVRGVGITVLD